ncbi:FAD-dependent oxidoreductase [Fastidiosibacter lacustris]|uniref:FAD-dependent oxidoreductase n=1 Tax=Fastidiosibacter lacustris TaxID=2056695 RepID=UPI000E349ED3|nr:FAD-dependent oxidoreductase [Fastidiosibacter lacustris]
MKVDVVVVGAGIQGLILTKKLRSEGASVLCVTNEHIGGMQTLRSQFYLHRGHFYREVDFARTLNNTYQHWESLLQELQLKTTVNQSYIGFNSVDDEAMWLDSWRGASIPFERTKRVPDVLARSACNTFYQFPHMLFSGQSLIDRLSLELTHSFIVGNITKITESSSGLHEVILVNNKQQKKIEAKYVILCAGSGNDALVDLIDIPGKIPQNMQKRRCQVLVLEGNLPNLSVLFPGLKMFIVPQYKGNKIYWLYTFGTDPVIETEQDDTNDKSHLNQQIQSLFRLFPLLKGLSGLTAFVYNATKIESSDLGQGGRPNQAYIYQVTPGILGVWPTKLSLAFEAAKEIVRCVKMTNQAPVLGKQEFLLSHYNNRKIALNHITQDSPRKESLFLRDSVAFTK